jgi:hypothetical protein
LSVADGKHLFKHEFVAMTTERALAATAGRILIRLLAVLSFGVALAAICGWASSVRYPSAGHSWGNDWYAREGVPQWTVAHPFASFGWVDARGAQRCVSIEGGNLNYTAVWERRFDDEYPMAGESGEWTFIVMWHRWGAGIFRADFAGMESAKILGVGVHLSWIIAATILLPGCWASAAARRRMGDGRQQRRRGFPVGVPTPAGGENGGGENGTLCGGMSGGKCDRRGFAPAPPKADRSGAARLGHKAGGCAAR